MSIALRFTRAAVQVMKRRSGGTLRHTRAVPNPAGMTQRTRKAIGTALVVAFLIVYALVMMAVGGELAVGRGMAIEFGFFLVAGLLWLPVVMAIIRWMVKPD